MNNIKTYKDGDRFVMVVENCNGAIATTVNEFITSILGIEAKPEPVPLVPIEVAEEEIPDTSSYEEITHFIKDEQHVDVDVFRFVDGIYKGMTFDEAKDKDGMKAIAYTFANVKKVAPDCPSQILQKCKELLFYDCGLGKYNPDLDSENDFRKFIETYDSMLNKIFKSMCEQAGYEDMQAMLASASENTWRSCYSLAKEKLLAMIQ